MARDSKVTVESFARQCHGQMIPLNKTCSYFSALPLEETALRKLLYEPIAAVPPRVGDTLPNLAFVLVPFLEKHKLTAAGEGGNRGKRRAGTTPGVTFDPPAATRRIYSATIGFKEQDFPVSRDQGRGSHRLSLQLVRRAGGVALSPSRTGLGQRLSRFGSGRAGR